MSISQIDFSGYSPDSQDDYDTEEQLEDRYGSLDGLIFGGPAVSDETLAEARRDRTLEDAGGGSTEEPDPIPDNSDEVKHDDGIGAYVWGGLTDVGAGTADAAQGVSDWAVGGVEKETGLRAWRQTETAQRLDEQVREGGILARIDAGAKGATDFLLDNPRLSLQEDVAQRAAVGAFRAGQFVGGHEPDATAEDVARAFGGAYEGTAETIESGVEGTPLDNPVTDAVAWGGQAIVADPAEAVFGGVTGIDVEEGDTEATVGAVDLFDVGVGTATLGGGTLLARGARESATEGTSLIGRLLGGGDEAAQAGDDVLDAQTRVFSGGDEAAGATEEAVARAVEDVGGAADEGGVGFRETVIQGSDEAAQATDDDVVQAIGTAGAAGGAAGAAPRLLDDLAAGLDELARAGEEALGVGRGATDEVAQAADEAAQAADDGGGLFGRLFGGSDEGAGAVDDAAQTGDEVAGATDEAVARAVDDVATGSDEGTSAFRRAVFGTTTTGRVARGAGVLLAGGAIGSSILDAPDRIETADGSVMTAAKDYEPTDRFPNGGKLYDVQRNGTSRGFWLLVGVRGRNLIVLTDDGDTRRAKISIDQFREMVRGGQGGSR